MCKHVWSFLFIVALLAPASLSFGQDLTDEQIINDYKAFMARPEYADCMALIKPTEFVVTERQLEENTFNTVKLSVTCDWVGDAKRFYKGPCQGLDKSRGDGQKAFKVLYYQLKDGKWVLTGLR